MTTTQQSHWDVIIIGAGLAGLLAAGRTAKAGLRTLVLERATQLGGRAASPQLHGIPVNPGARAISTSAIGLLQEEGIEVTGGSPKPSVQFVTGMPGESLQQLPLMQVFLGKWATWSEKMQLVRFLIRSRQVELTGLQTVSIERYLADTLPSPRIRRIVLSLIRLATYCDAPAQMSAKAALTQLREKVVYVNGGWASLVKSLKQQAIAAGAVIRNESAVAKIQGEAPELRIVLKDGTVFYAANVLSTIGPKPWLKLLDPPLAEGVASRYDNLVPVYAACLDLIMKRLPKPNKTFAIGVDQPWYFANHSAVSTFSEHPEQEIIHVMKYLPPGLSPSIGDDQQELEAFLDEIQPGWQDHVLERRFLPRMLVSHAVSEPSPDDRKPGPVITARPGLYVAGDWVGENMLVKASLVSAREAATAIIARHGSTNHKTRNGDRAIPC
ncbi:phytoene desaturase family protein [Paenibacillus daejeonensis]|uniref:phytoene desaturase family protein n=1 Tax=Paenibacillus daejeonensis TaxID=135193 RepID=UPI000373991C|nr:FAD-dependent oxidoreductase [Paenibacillus daejeonensis]